MKNDPIYISHCIANSMDELFTKEFHKWVADQQINSDRETTDFLRNKMFEIAVKNLQNRI